MVVNDDDNDGVVMDHIAADKSFQVNSVNNDDDHDDNYDNLFRWTSIISLLQTYLFRPLPLLSPSSQYRRMAKTLQTSFSRS